MPPAVPRGAAQPAGRRPTPRKRPGCCARRRLVPRRGTTLPRPSRTGSTPGTRTARRICCARRCRWFLERGALSAHLQLGRRLPATTVLRDPGLAVSLAWAAGLSGQFARMGPWLDVADASIGRRQPRAGGMAQPARSRGDDACGRASTVRADTDAALVAATTAGRAGDRSGAAGLRGGPDGPRGDAQLRRPFRGGGPAPRRRVGPRARARPTAAARAAGRQHPRDGLCRHRPHRPAAPAPRGRGARGPAGRGAVGQRHSSRNLAAAHRRGPARASGRRPRRRPVSCCGAPSSWPAPSANLGTGHRTDQPRRRGARRPRPHRGPRGSRRGTGGRRHRAGPAALRAPPCRHRAADRPRCGGRGPPYRRADRGADRSRAAPSCGR